MANDGGVMPLTPGERMELDRFVADGWSAEGALALVLARRDIRAARAALATESEGQERRTDG